MAQRQPQTTSYPSNPGIHAAAHTGQSSINTLNPPPHVNTRAPIPAPSKVCPTTTTFPQTPRTTPPALPTHTHDPTIPAANKTPQTTKEINTLQTRARSTSITSTTTPSTAAPASQPFQRQPAPTPYEIPEQSLIAPESLPYGLPRRDCDLTHGIVNSPTYLVALPFGGWAEKANGYLREKLGGGGGS